MQNPRQLYNKGGIMNVSPRQQYGLGSFVKKAVKGVTGAVKKFAKSDLGKAALIGAAGFGIPGTSFGGLFGRAGFGGAATGLFGKAGIGATFSGLPGADAAAKFLGKEKTLGNTLKVFAGGSVIGSLLAGAEEEGATRNVDALRSYLENGYRNLGYSDDEIPGLVDQGVSEYSQDTNRTGAMYGGRMKLEEGTLDPRIREIVIDLMDNEGFEFGEAVKEAYKRIEQRAKGGRIGYAYGSDDLVDQASGIMDLPINQNKAGVKELDLRETGGFIPPVGVKEKADDIPAMLSNNEFVFTADSVREFGDGDVNKGAQRMYDMMKKLEKGGRV
jgi:hypothetical protein